MYDQIMDTYRRAAESTMQMQQTMLRSWSQQWPQMFGMGPMAGPGGAVLDQAHTAQRKWADTVTSLLEKHRETLDHQYRAGIKTIEEAFRVGEARDPEHFRKLVEELWKHSFEMLRKVSEDQIEEFQSAMRRVFEMAGTAPSGKR